MADRGAKTATIARCLAVISQAHKAAHPPSPTSSSSLSPNPHLSRSNRAWWSAPTSLEGAKDGPVVVRGRAGAGLPGCASAEGRDAARPAARLARHRHPLATRQRARASRRPSTADAGAAAVWPRAGRHGRPAARAGGPGGRSRAHPSPSQREASPFTPRSASRWTRLWPAAHPAPTAASVRRSNTWPRGKGVSMATSPGATVRCERSRLAPIPRFVRASAAGGQPHTTRLSRDSVLWLAWAAAARAPGQPGLSHWHRGPPG